MDFLKKYWSWVKENHLERIEVVNNIAIVVGIIAIVISAITLFS